MPFGNDRLAVAEGPIQRAIPWERECENPRTRYFATETLHIVHKEVSSLGPSDGPTLTSKDVRVGIEGRLPTEMRVQHP
jgi:hypothetical protein